MKTTPVKSINEVVTFERVPTDYVRIIPFCAVIHTAKDDLTPQEREIVKEAIATAGREIQRARGVAASFETLFP